MDFSLLHSVYTGSGGTPGLPWGTEKWRELTVHLHHVPRFRMSGAVPSLLTTHSVFTFQRNCTDRKHDLASDDSVTGY